MYQNPWFFRNIEVLKMVPRSWSLTLNGDFYSTASSIGSESDKNNLVRRFYIRYNPTCLFSESFSKCFMNQGSTGSPCRGEKSKFFEITIFQSDRRGNQTVDYVTLMYEEKKSMLDRCDFCVFSWFFLHIGIQPILTRLWNLTKGIPIENWTGFQWKSRIFKFLKNHEKTQKSQRSSIDFFSSYIKVT